MKNLVNELVRFVRAELGHVETKEILTPNGAVIFHAPGTHLDIRIRNNYSTGRTTLAVKLQSEFVIQANE